MARAFHGAGTRVVVWAKGPHSGSAACNEPEGVEATVSPRTRTVLEMVKGSLFVFAVNVVLPFILPGHVNAVLQGRPLLLA